MWRIYTYTNVPLQSIYVPHNYIRVYIYNTYSYIIILIKIIVKIKRIHQNITRNILIYMHMQINTYIHTVNDTVKKHNN